MNYNTVYRVNLWVTIFHVLMAATVILGGGIPWVQLAMMPINGGIALYHRNKHIAQVESKAKETKAIEADKATDYCTLWEIRKTERKMADAGIIKLTEMSVCENENCSDCTITRNSIQNEQYHERRVKAIEAKAQYHRKSKWQHDLERKHMEEMAIDRMLGRKIPPADYVKSGHVKPTHQMGRCPNCNVLTVYTENMEYGKFCLPCGANRKEKDAQRRKMLKAQASKATFRGKSGRIRQLSNGLAAIMPPNVPSFAHAAISYRSGEPREVIWTWSYDDAKHFEFRSPLDVETTDIVADSGIVHTVHEINDPDTGEHLGSISVSRKTGEATIINRNGGVVGPKGPIGPSGWTPPTDPESDPVIIGRRA